MKILILCTGNSCRSQMAEGFLRSFDPKLEVFSGGTEPAEVINPNAVKVMHEINIDISKGQPNSVNDFLDEPFDYVITVCGGAKETCPIFRGDVKHNLHIGFDDPVDAVGTDEEVMAVYRRVRDEIKRDFSKFYNENIKFKAMKIQEKDLKDIVKSKYNLIADQSNDESCCCCKGDSAAWDKDYTIFSESYKKLEGYNEDADLGLGCGLPTEFAQISKGDTVLDLGSGAGNDCFVARAIVGESGKVIGIDFADKMLEKARKNAETLGLKNVDFVKGDIDQMPLESNSIDVVVSNCVLNLVPDKVKAFAEIHRVLKPGGHFSVSDIVISGTLPEKLLKEAEMYAGCVAGAIANTEYVGIVKAQGFTEIKVPKVKEIDIPDETLNKYLDPKEVENYRNSDIGIFSITVFAKK